MTTCACTIYAHEGLRAIYTMYPTILMMDIPFAAMQFGVYIRLDPFINRRTTMICSSMIKMTT